MIPCSRNPILKTAMFMLVATLSLGLTSTALAQGVVVNGVAPDGEPGGFGIDGNLRANSPGGAFSTASDWTPGPAGIGVGKLLCPSGAPIDATKTFHIVDLTGNDDLNVFAESDKVQDDPNTYNWKAGSVPQKDDINNGLIHLSLEPITGDLWAMMGGDRRATNGDSYIDFEYLQNTLTKNLDGSFTSLGPDGGRTVGDILLTIHLIRGGDSAELFAQRWQSDGGGGFNYFDFTPAPGDAFVAANVDSAVNVCFGAFGSTTYEEDAFGEAAANLSNIITGFDPCFAISTLWIRTKSSQSFTAQLKDMIEPIQLSLCFDEEPPVITCPTDKVFDCVMGNAGTATANDNCEVDTIFFEDNVTSSRCPITIERSWIAVDVCGNADTCVQTITIRDITDPVITCPDDIVFDCTLGDAGVATATDNCDPDPDVSSSDTTISARCPIIIDRTWIATDSCGNADTCVQRITVRDITDPVITCPDDIVFDCTMGDAGVATATDNCDPDPDVTSSDDTTSARCPIIIERTWVATDTCGNDTFCVQTITVQDTAKPTISCPANDTVECVAAVIFGTPTANDNCDPDPEIVIVSTIGVDGPGVGESTFTRCWEATDSCGNVSDTCCQSITREACPKEEFCSLTQGFYGNAGGTFNGQGTLALIQSLICPASDLVVGKPGRSLTITCAAASCIIQRLPAGGTATTLPNFGDEVLDPSPSCQTSPTAIPLNLKGRFLNVLLGQTIALSLNVRLDTDLGSFELCNQFQTQKALPGPDGLLGTADDVLDPGLDGLLGTADDPIATFIIPVSVLTALSNLGLPNTVSGLLELANRALAGQATGGASIADINFAVDAINRGFDKCRFVISCVNPLSAKVSVGATSASAEIPAEEEISSGQMPKEFVLSQSYPNPFNASTTIKYALPNDGKVTLAVYNILGQKVITLLDGIQTAGYHTVTWNGKNASGNDIASGVYFYRIQFGNETQIKRMTLLK